MAEKTRIIPKGIAWPFALLTILFFAWAVPNNLTDTMLAAFKRIMSLSDSKTAWIQIVCYLLGYGCFAVPGALFIQKYSYKSGVMLGLGVYALGAILFYPAMKISMVSVGVGFYCYLLAIFVLFAGLSILETSTNSFICALGPEETATQRLNFAQSFNPFGAIAGVVISQVFILSQLNTKSAAERAALSDADLAAIQGQELNAVTNTYVILGLVMVAILLAIFFTKMPAIKETGRIDLKGSSKRLVKNKNYVLGVTAQFFYVGAQIAVWSYVIRYAMHTLDLDGIIAALGEGATTTQIMDALRNVEPIGAAFYNFFESIGLDDLLPRTAEQAGATYYIMSLVLFVAMRFVCTFLMKYIKPHDLLAVISAIAVACCLGTIYGHGPAGVYCLIGISGCMSLMFPTIYGIGTEGLGEDLKLGGSGMVMAIAGAALLTQLQGMVSDSVGSIATAYWVPAIAFAIILAYSCVIAIWYVKARSKARA
ncbi:MAG: L-fucose:H+ symporter permease [Bacteroidales bacterium]|nr:L-fucose:H+ symporter permease [Bacteroidales bacterium]